MFKKKVLAAIVGMGMVFSLAGCGQTNEQTNQPSGANNNQAQVEKLSGGVIIDGSGTVYPLMAHIAEEYMTNVQSNVSVQVGRAGSSAGFKKFIPGETDFADASRKIKNAEVEELKGKGMEMDKNVMEIKLAYDGLTIVINKNNDWAKEMTDDEIIKMFTSKAVKADDKVLWSDIRSEWPKEEIKFYGPNENHGTYEFFYETILEKKDLVSTVNLQQEYSTLVDLVSQDKNAIAFFGYGYYASNTNKLAAVKVDFGKGPVEPALNTIGEDLDYAGFTRLVYTYLNLNYAKEKPQVLDFAKYVVSPEGAGKLAADNGFAPLPDSVYAEYASALKALK
ncbi:MULTISPECIES: PstS family phosphate ABC transporter substrate-binding protein [Desulfitobacterium]|uniref:Phosphate-binding protein n=1 Tax=Desulfitobacterium dehalogenans (strain ATCC 51507 / DSM 9161 / JW/IU-DC1) TaxID=756499 RepID=I4A6L5_DESDJ|nr:MULTISPECIES: PstS family phosphate ABC transporter substrate-binding protein [Desulfitobacterium]AFL99599.1 phosphate ABC transporter substrate-binding protein, PhoT family [Desulfitobacterium dehalogenans ATCC 51507]